MKKMREKNHWKTFQNEASPSRGNRYDAFFGPLHYSYSPVPNLCFLKQEAKKRLTVFYSNFQSRYMGKKGEHFERMKARTKIYDGSYCLH